MTKNSMAKDFKKALSKRKPKGKAGMAAVKRLGRDYATGTFDKIVESVKEKGGSEEKAKAIAGKAYWDKVRARKAKAGAKK